MGKLFLAGIGGFIGSTLRYAVTGYVQTWTKSIDFPYGTLSVNLIGCFAIGFLLISRRLAASSRLNRAR